MYNRLIKLNNNNSIFLFGARGTGKTYLLKNQFEDKTTIYIDLLEPETYLQYSLRPSSLKEYIDTLNSGTKWIIIDEIQKLPGLLDVVHKCIEEKKLKFILTGSSARIIKRGGANLLAGRAFINKLFPLSYKELGKDFNLTEVLQWGSLPGIFSLNDTEDKKDFLRSYAFTYIKEEITEEQTVRKLEPFRKFLYISAQMSGKIINYSKIARESNTSTTSIISYFQILEDTLIGITLDAYHTSVRKSQKQRPKFYYFDTGVLRSLNNTLTLDVLPQTCSFGNLFEHFIINEVNKLNHYYKKDYRLYYYQTKSGLEIDFVIERPGEKTALLEIKSTDNITPEQIKPLISISKDFKNSESFCFSLDKVPKKIENVYCCHWQKGLNLIGLE